MENKTILVIKGSFIAPPALRAQVAARLYQTLFSIAQFIQGSITLGEDKYLVWTMTHSKEGETNVLLGEVCLMQEGDLTLNKVPNICIIGENVRVGSEAEDHPFNVHSNIARQLKAG